MSLRQLQHVVDLEVRRAQRVHAADGLGDAPVPRARSNAVRSTDVTLYALDQHHFVVEQPFVSSHDALGARLLP